MEVVLNSKVTKFSDSWAARVVPHGEREMMVLTVEVEGRVVLCSGWILKNFEKCF